MSDFQEKWQKASKLTADFEKRKRKWSEKNLHQIFEAFEENNILSATAEYSGSGDSGSFESVQFEGGEVEDNITVELTVMTGSFDYQTEKWQEELREGVLCTLKEACQDMAEALLDATHGGWENNEGGAGKAVFSLENRTLLLSHTEYIHTEQNYKHEIQAPGDLELLADAHKEAKKAAKKKGKKK